MTRVCLRSGAPLGRQTSCALVDPSEVRMDADTVLHALVEPRLALPRIPVAIVRGDGVGDGALLLLPSGESAWLPGEALDDADGPGLVRVVRPFAAHAVRISACWITCEPPDADAWLFDRFDAEYVYLQRDLSGPLHRALREDVIIVDGAVPWQSALVSLVVEDASSATTEAAWSGFLQRLLGDAVGGSQIRGADRWTIDIPGPQAEPPVEDVAPQAVSGDPVGPVHDSSEATTRADPVDIALLHAPERPIRDRQRPAAEPPPPRRTPDIASPSAAHGQRAAVVVAPSAGRPPPAAPSATPERPTQRDVLMPKRAVEDAAAEPPRPTRTNIVAPTVAPRVMPSVDVLTDAPHFERRTDGAAQRPTQVLRPSQSPRQRPSHEPEQRPAPRAPADLPMSPRTAETGVNPATATPAEVRRRAQGEPTSARAAAFPPGPPLVRGLALLPEQPEPAASLGHEHTRRVDDPPARAPAAPYRKPAFHAAAVAYQAGSASIELGTIEVQIGDARTPSGGGTAEPFTSAATTRATTRTGSLLAEIPTSRTWKGLL